MFQYMKGSCSRFGGDQLTSERSRHGQMAVQDGDTPAARLEGLACKTEGWHARVTLLQIIFDLLYKEESDDGNTEAT